MKILITILMTLFISNNANAIALSTEDILSNGTVITTAIIAEDTWLQFIVKHQSKFYRCSISVRSTAETTCRELAHTGARNARGELGSIE